MEQQTQWPQGAPRPGAPPVSVEAPSEPSEEIDALLADAGLDDRSLERMTSEMASHVNRCFQAAKIAKEPHEREMLDCLRQREGIYDPETAAIIQDQGGSHIFMMITQLKIRAAKAWIVEVLFPRAGQLPVDCEPTPVADLPDFVHQEIAQRVQEQAREAVQSGLYITPADIARRTNQVESDVMRIAQNVAKEKAKRMRLYITDILQEAHWKEEIVDFIDDFLTFQTGFMKGPYGAMSDTLEWTDEGGSTRPVRGRKRTRKYKRMSPFDAYPSPDARDIHDGYFIERMTLRRNNLFDMIGVGGYNEDSIRAVIQEFGEQGHRLNLTNDEERNRLEGRNHERYSPDATFDVLNFWGRLRGQWLVDHGVPESQISDLDRDYEANVMVIGEHVIKASLNPHPLGKRPYVSESFERVNGKIWGKGLAQIIRDIQAMCNASARSLANNMALASGPMVEVQVDRLADGEGVVDLYPWRQFQTTESKVGSGSGGRAINFFQPNSNAEQLMAVYKFFAALADEYTGIPPYTMGSNVSGGAASTASGLGMLIEGAARGVKLAIAGIDRVIEYQVQQTFVDVMMNDPIEHIKGDLKIIATGSKGMLNREQANMRRIELLQVMAGSGVTEQIGIGPTIQMLRQIFEGAGLDPEKLPNEDEIKQMVAGQQQQMQQQLEQRGPQVPTGRQMDNSGAVAGGRDARVAA